MTTRYNNLLVRRCAEQHGVVLPGKRVGAVALALTAFAAFGCAADATGSNAAQQSQSDRLFEFADTDARTSGASNGRWSFDEKDVKALPEEDWFDSDTSPEERSEIIAAYEEDARDQLRLWRREGYGLTVAAPICEEIDASGNRTVRDSTLGHRLHVGGGISAKCTVYADQRDGAALQLRSGQWVCAVSELTSLRGISERGLTVQASNGSGELRRQLLVDSASGDPVEVRQATLGSVCAYPIRAEVEYRIIDVHLTDEASGCAPFLTISEKAPTPERWCVVDGDPESAAGNTDADIDADTETHADTDADADADSESATPDEEQSSAD